MRLSFILLWGRPFCSEVIAWLSRMTKQKQIVNMSCVEWLMSISVEYNKTLINNLSFDDPLLQILIACSTYEIFRNGFCFVYLRSQTIIFGKKCGLRRRGNERWVFNLPWESKTMQTSSFLLFSKYSSCFSSSLVSIKRITTTTTTNFESKQSD